MPKQTKDLSILYMQIRADAETREEEFQEFIRFSGLAREQFTVLNVFDTPHFDSSIITGHDALFVGGSSDASVLKPKEYPFVPSSEALLKYCAENSIPTFASCYGFQAVTVALGGTVIEDLDHLEMGTYAIHLTEAGKEDPLFHDTPSGFMSVSGHKERASILPEGAVLLAYSDLCPFHAFTIPGKPFYAFQFHPEIDRADLCARIVRYKDRGYLQGDTDQALLDLLETASETTESNKLVKKFVDRILIPNT